MCWFLLHLDQSFGILLLHANRMAWIKKSQSADVHVRPLFLKFTFGQSRERSGTMHSLLFPTLLYSHIGLNTMTTLRLMNVYLGLVVRKPVNANLRLKVNQLSLLICLIKRVFKANSTDCLKATNVKT